MMDPRRERGSEEGEILLVDKPKGWTSFDVVHKVRNVLRVKRAGHAGTLDPLATGLLIVCTGKRTRDIGMFVGLEKEYEGEMCLGGETASYDRETPVVNLRSTEGITADRIRTVLAEFVGWSTQIPPMWSAAKVRGKRLYAYARRGENVERKPREVYIRALEAMAIDVPVVKFRVNCSKGTYVRTLVHEVGRKLGCGAYLTALVRTKIGDYSLHDAVTIEQLASACRMQGIPSAGKLGAQ